MLPNPQETADSVTFTEEVLYGKHFFCTVNVAIVNKNFAVINHVIRVRTLPGFLYIRN